MPDCQGQTVQAASWWNGAIISRRHCDIKASHEGGQRFAEFPFVPRLTHSVHLVLGAGLRTLTSYGGYIARRRKRSLRKVGQLGHGPQWDSRLVHLLFAFITDPWKGSWGLRVWNSLCSSYQHICCRENQLYIASVFPWELVLYLISQKLGEYSTFLKSQEQIFLWGSCWPGQLLMDWE